MADLTIDGPELSHLRNQRLSFDLAPSCSLPPICWSLRSLCVVHASFEPLQLLTHLHCLQAVARHSPIPRESLNRHCCICHVVGASPYVLYLYAKPTDQIDVSCCPLLWWSRSWALGADSLAVFPSSVTTSFGTFARPQLEGNNSLKRVRNYLRIIELLTLSTVVGRLLSNMILVCLIAPGCFINVPIAVQDFHNSGVVNLALLTATVRIIARSIITSLLLVFQR